MFRASGSRDLPAAGLLRTRVWLAVVFALIVGRGSLAAAEEPAAPLEVAGRVIDAQGSVLAGVRVRVEVPGTNRSFAEPDSNQPVIESTTDEQGRYEIELPLHGETSLTVEAFQRGFLSKARTFRFGEERFSGRVGEEYTTRVRPGETIHASFILQPGLYVAGMAVDEAGQAISDVEISASVGPTKTDAQGRFEILNFPLLREPWRGSGLFFEHARFVNADVDDVYALDAAQRASLRIVLKAGQKITGRVLRVGQTAGRRARRSSLRRRLVRASSRAHKARWPLRFGRPPSGAGHAAGSRAGDQATSQETAFLG
jgi:hypothetical protein